MDKEKQIEEMAHFICERDSEELCTLDRKRCDLKCTSGDIAKHLHNKGYRKIYDDHQRQCTCYALGCQMAEQLKREVARDIIADLERAGLTESRYPVIAELKMKYESEKDK